MIGGMVKALRYVVGAGMGLAVAFYVAVIAVAGVALLLAWVNAL